MTFQKNFMLVEYQNEEEKSFCKQQPSLESAGISIVPKDFIYWTKQAM